MGTMGILVSSEERQRIVSGWEEWRRILYEERAAIIQFDGKTSKEQAELWAFDYYQPAPTPVQRKLDL